ncbi:G-protein coupled receptor 54-like [Anneissia japonica]|uniref:G-protein coupled receptor 54-like n=1 Tax=Anneissia japonica TaxID=1529436 RepID=UPI0014259FC5|nr:G-protein coupled receptor 54-like [Anneissia japonica]XP_033114496.1 G-protein coupled receptor 54-like [Anneissia japonica]XP_033114497.1 G-protein coupled receptor 54-like [Anneissia japonica]
MDESYSDEFPNNGTIFLLDSIPPAFTIVLATVVFVVGVPANALVIYVIIKNGKMKTVTNIYVFNLAITDILFIIFATPISISWYVASDFQYGTVLCKLQTFLYQTNYAVTVLTLTTLAVDRVYAVVYPVKSRAHRTLKSTGVMIALIWILGCLSQIVCIFYTSQLFGQCFELWPSSTERQLFYCCLFVFFYIIPVIINTVCYTMIGCRLWRTTTESSIYRINHPKSVMQRRRISTMIMLVVLCFAVCWLPFHVLALLENFHFLPVTQSVSYLKIFSKMLAVSNSCVDPFVYAFVSMNFRRSFKCAFHTLFNSDHNNVVLFAPDPDDKHHSRIQKSFTLSSRTKSSRSSGNSSFPKVGKPKSNLKDLMGTRETNV